MATQLPAGAVAPLRYRFQAKAEKPPFVPLLGYAVLGFDIC